MNTTYAIFGIVMLAALVSATAFYDAPATYADHGIEDRTPPEIFFCYDDSLLAVEHVSTDDRNVSIDLIVRDDHGLSSIWYFDGNSEADVTDQRPFTTSQYPPGVYTLMANATDASSRANTNIVESYWDLHLTLERAATITINTVVIRHDSGTYDCPDLVPPTISIKSSGTTGTPSTSFVLTANAHDARSTPTVVWYNNGVEIGQGTKITRTFSVGTHDITAIATDVQVLQYTGLPPDYEVIPGVTPYVPANTKESGSIRITVASPPAPDTTPPSVVIGSNDTSGTPDTHFLFTATASDASGIASVVWYDGTTQIGTGTTITRMFGAGTHSITAVATDGSPTSNTARSNPILISISNPIITPPDTTPPDITISADPPTSGTPSTSFTLTATVSDASGIASIVWRDGNTIIDTGETITRSFNLGTHVITATATDAATPSNTRTSESITIEIMNPPDTIDPEITIHADRTLGTTATSFTLTATATDASGISSIVWYNGNTQIGTGASITTKFDADSHTITAVATDNSENSNTATSNTITLVVSLPPDNLPPTIFISPSATSGTTDDIFTFTAAASDASGIASIIWYEGTTQLGTGNTLTQTFAAGNHTIHAVATDNSENSNTATSNTITLVVSLPSDNLPPTIAISSNAMSGTTDDVFTLDATASDASGIASIIWYEGTTQLGTGNTLTQTFEAGNHTIHAVATDNSENSNTAISNTITLVVSSPSLPLTPPPSDTLPPSIDISASSTSGTPSTSFTLSASASDASGIASIIWYEGTTQLETGNKLTQTFEAGNHTIHAVATDNSENSNTAISNTITLVVSLPPDNLPPTIAISSNAMSGTTDDIFTLDATTIDASGIASIIWYEGTTQLGTGNTLTQTFAAGNHTIHAVATDNSENSNTATSNTITLVVSQPLPPSDDTPPTISISSNATSGTTDDTFTLDAAAADANGIARIAWYNGITLIGTGESLSIMFDAGRHTITAVAIDGSAESNEHSSDPIVIVVTTPAHDNTSSPPTITIASDAMSGTTATTTFQLVAIAENGEGGNDNNIHIAWYDGNQQIGQGSSIIHAFDTAGTHIITARVTSGDGSSQSGASVSNTIVIEIIDGQQTIPLIPLEPSDEPRPAAICR